MPSTPLPNVSVVIPTYGRPGQLTGCLAALGRQALPREAFEVVVVDDGSPIPLDGVIASIDDGLRPRLVRQANAGPATARNRGVNEARGTLVAFTDDDCRPEPDWLAALVAAEHRFPGALVGGSTINGLPRELFASASQLIIDMVYDHFNVEPSDAYFLTSNNMLCNREAYLSIGGFDASFPRAGAEDRDFCDRWRAAGRRLAWVPEARIEHRHSQSLRKFLDLHYRYGRGAHRYQSIRRSRGTGTMKQDLGFHASLPRRLWRALGRERGMLRRAQLAGALCLWQVANAAGFLAEAWSPRGGPRGCRP
jgi:GT2 family glycosyltransferase